MNYEINDTILYGADGVCQISEVTERKIDSKICKYYILNPVYDKKSTIFVPFENDVLLSKMRNLPTKAEIDAALSEAVAKTPVWIEDDGERKEYLKKITDSGTIFQLLFAVKALYIHQNKQIDCGKKLHVADEKSLKDIEKIIFDEFAYVKGFERPAVKAFIAEKLNNLE